jgi:murein DD-endopeptidase MepM/ murein hydrolase activator NlpD
VRPVFPCRVSQPFADPGSYASRRDGHGPAGHHTGTDFGSAWPIPIAGRVVRAVLSGEVVISEYNATMGNWVGVYNHEHNLLVTYWHMSGRNVQKGDWINAYHVVGRVGSTGNSTAAHLHVQVNRGPLFDYHGHINPWQAFKLTKRWKARKAYKKNPRHPRA